MDDDDALARHLEYMRMRNLRQSTVDQRRRALRRLTRSLSTPLLDATGTQLLDYFSGLRTRPVSVAADLSNVRCFYRWALFVELIDRDPTIWLVRPKLPRRLPRPMPDADMARALTAAPLDVYRILMLAAYAGLRACEIAQLRGEQILLDQVPPLIVLDESKGGGMSSVPIAPALMDMLRAMPTHGLCFPRRNGRPGQWKAWSVSHRANTFLHELGITHTLHTLRHWYGTHLHRASGGNLRITQEGMRHRSPVSTALYSFVTPGEVATAVAGLPQLAA